MGDGDPPEALARRIELREQPALRYGDAERLKIRIARRRPAARHIEQRETVGDGEELDDPAVAGGQPGAGFAVVVADWNDAADRKTEKVFDVVENRLAENDRLRPDRDGFIRRKLDGVGVGNTRRQRPWHGGKAAWPGGVFGGAHRQGCQGLEVPSGITI